VLLFELTSRQCFRRANRSRTPPGAWACGHASSLLATVGVAPRVSSGRCDRRPRLYRHDRRHHSSQRQGDRRSDHQLKVPASSSSPVDKGAV
jgi:hypothetical protein